MHIICLPKGKGQYDAHLQDGSLLISSTITPFFSSARELKARGIPDDTELSMSHAGSTAISMRSTIGVASGLTVAENAKQSLILRKYRPFDAEEVIPSVTVSRTEAFLVQVW